ncbi:hypothetical protein UlMin_012911 [Ulmus minor]
MTCFIILDSIIKDIEAACARFWWGSTMEYQKVHWKNWEDICQPKYVGGLGFKNLSLFNQALLRKQVWCFIQRPNSLGTQIFKAKYYHNSTIWEVDASTNSSYVWRSILWEPNGYGSEMESR